MMVAVSTASSDFSEAQHSSPMRRVTVPPDDPNGPVFGPLLAAIENDDADEVAAILRQEKPDLGTLCHWDCGSQFSTDGETWPIVFAPIRGDRDIVATL